jgi:hypothetical protein
VPLRQDRCRWRARPGSNAARMTFPDSAHHGPWRALAIAEMQGLTGEDLLLGLVAGYEVEIRLRDAIATNERQGWDDTSIAAQYASAATAGKLLGLDETKLANALAIAGSNANTLAEVRQGAAMTPAKGSAEPMAIRNGVFAALLARAGLDYPLTIFEVKNGFGQAVSGSFDEAVLRTRSGDFQILKSCIKLWPCAGTIQAPIAAALQIGRQQLRAEEISAVTVELSEFAYKAAGGSSGGNQAPGASRPQRALCGGASAAGWRGRRGRFRGNTLHGPARLGAYAEIEASFRRLALKRESGCQSRSGIAERHYSQCKRPHTSQQHVKSGQRFGIDNEIRCSFRERTRPRAHPAGRRDHSRRRNRIRSHGTGERAFSVNRVPSRGWLKLKVA